jgi:hypothetical protein
MKRNKYSLFGWITCLSCAVLLWQTSVQVYDHSSTVFKEESIIPVFIVILLIGSITGLLFSALAIYQTLRNTTLAGAVFRIAFLHFPCLVISCVYLYGVFIFLTWL